MIVPAADAALAVANSPVSKGNLGGQIQIKCFKSTPSAQIKSPMFLFGMFQIKNQISFPKHNERIKTQDGKQFLF